MHRVGIQENEYFTLCDPGILHFVTPVFYTLAALKNLTKIIAEKFLVVEKFSYIYLLNKQV